MPLQSAFQAELAKQTRPGYAAASDVLRLTVLQRFGGYYADGEYVTTTDTLEEIDRVLRSEAAFGIHQHGEFLGNDVLVMPKGHPVLEEFLGLYRHNYGMPQLDLMAGVADRAPEEFVEVIGLRARRHSVMGRTGPDNLHTLADWLGWQNVADLPAVVTGSVESGSSWTGRIRPSASVTTENWEATVELTKKVVQTLVRDLHNRVGDLHLTVVADAVALHQDPALIWTAALGYLASRPEYASVVRTVTDRELIAAGDERTIVLPREAARFLVIDTDESQVSNFLAEYTRPATMAHVPGLLSDAETFDTATSVSFEETEDDALQEEILFPEGTKTFPDGERPKLNRIATLLAESAVERRGSAVAKPAATVIGHGNGSLLGVGQAVRTGKARADATVEALRDAVAEELDRLQRDDPGVMTGGLVTTGDVDIVAGSKGRAVGAVPAGTSAEQARRRAVITVDLDPERRPGRSSGAEVVHRNAAQWSRILDEDAEGRTEPDGSLVADPAAFPSTREQAWTNLLTARRSLRGAQEAHAQLVSRFSGPAGSSRDATRAGNLLQQSGEEVSAALGRVERAAADLLAWGNDAERLDRRYRDWMAASLRERPRLDGGAGFSSSDDGTDALAHEVVPTAEGDVITLFIPGSMPFGASLAEFAAVVAAQARPPVLEVRGRFGDPRVPHISDALRSALPDQQAGDLTLRIVTSDEGDGVRVVAVPGSLSFGEPVAVTSAELVEEVSTPGNRVVRLTTGSGRTWQLDVGEQVTVHRGENEQPISLPRAEFVAQLTQVLGGYHGGALAPEVERRLFGGPLVDANEAVSAVLGGRLVFWLETAVRPEKPVAPTAPDQPAAPPRESTVDSLGGSVFDVLAPSGKRLVRFRSRSDVSS
ncbi:hypothetical protein LFM09_49505 [Lentzea alba]|uniref:hypothetical protein n=1 Tax=Lentzea alba TaxID=2714351 RepID=UPI0039BF45A6